MPWLHEHNFLFYLVQRYLKVNYETSHLCKIIWFSISELHNLTRKIFPCYIRSRYGTVTVEEEMSDFFHNKVGFNLGDTVTCICLISLDWFSPNRQIVKILYSWLNSDSLETTGTNVSTVECSLIVHLLLTIKKIWENC